MEGSGEGQPPRHPTGDCRENKARWADALPWIAFPDRMGPRVACFQTGLRASMVSAATLPRPSNRLHRRLWTPRNPLAEYEGLVLPGIDSARRVP